MSIRNPALTHTSEESVSLLDDRIRHLRRRYAGRRLLDIFAAAVTIDISLDLLAYTTFSLFQWFFHVPFFLEIFLAVLLTREAGRLRKNRFTQLLDSRFELQDRLYSFLWYGGAESVPAAVREAQAKECLKSIDFVSMKRKLKPRVPPILFVTLPLFLGLTWWYLNVDYTPPSTFTTTILKIVTPNKDNTKPMPGEKNPLDDETRQGEDQPDAAEGVDSATAPEIEPSSSEAALESEESEPVDPATTTEKRDPSANRGGGPELEKDEAGGGAIVPEDEQAQTEGPIQSNPVTDEVSEVGPARLRDEPSLSTPSVQEPDHLISLLPWSLKSSASGNQVYVPNIPGYDISQYPIQYRSHLTRYQKELQTWATTR